MRGTAKFPVVETGMRERPWAVLDAETQVPVAYARTSEDAQQLSERFTSDGLPDDHPIHQTRKLLAKHS
jgi:hypothetical protein